MTTEEILSRLKGVKQDGQGWTALCPAHADKNPSLTITRAQDGKTLVTCHAGCKFPDIATAMMLKKADFFDDNKAGTDRRQQPAPNNKPRGALYGTIEAATEAARLSCGENYQFIAKWPYHNASGEIVAYAERFEIPEIGRDSKTYRPIRKDGKGWRIGDPDGDWPLYGLPELLKAGATEPVFITEGEKAADAAWAIGLIATTSAHGAKSADKTDWKPLSGRDVVILPDNDTSGEGYTDTVKGIINEVTPPAKVRILRLPGLPPKGDMVEFLAARNEQTQEQIRAELTALLETAKRETPPAKVSEDETTKIQAAFWELSRDANKDRGQRFKEMAAVVLDFLHKRGRFFYHEEYKNFLTVMFFDARRKLLLKLASDEFQSWLSIYIGLNRTEPAFKFIFAALEDEALTGKTTGLQPEMFWASRKDTIYLSNGDGQAVKITANQFGVVDNGTDNVLFAAGRTLAPWTLTKPADPFETCRLFSDMKTTARHAKELLRLFFCSIPTNQRTRPHLTLTGVIGSGKTRVAVGLFELLGMGQRISAITKKGEKDFWTQINTGGLVCFDNADTRIEWLADALAAASTDGSHETRELYTDNGVNKQRSRAWIVITSANPTFASDSGLADRLLVIRLERRTEETAESALSNEIAANRDAGLSWLTDTLSKALADTETVKGNLNKRHPDFASFAVHIGRAIGREQEAIEALKAAESDKSQFNLENDDMGLALIVFMQERTEAFTGTAQDLFEALKDGVAGLDDSYWTIKKISRRIEKLWPHIEAMFSAKKEKGHGGYLTYHFKPNGEIGEFKPPVLHNPPMREDIGTLVKTSAGSHHTHHGQDFTEPDEATRLIVDGIQQHFEEYQRV